jgi:hypothetical protein
MEIDKVIDDIFSEYMSGYIDWKHFATQLLL